jgi:hypothetical protein
MLARMVDAVDVSIRGKARASGLALTRELHVVIVA